MLLALLDLDASVLAHTAVQLNTALVCLYAQLDTRTRRHQSQDLKTRISRVRVRCTVGNEGIVDSSASCSAISLGIGNVLADCGLWLGEVQSGTSSELDLTIGNENAIGSDSTLGIRHVKCVVQDRHGVVVDERPQVPINVVGEHYWSGFVEWNGNQARDPCRAFAIVCESVGCDVQKIAGEALFSSIVVRERDARSCVRDYSPVALVVANITTMKCVGAIVLVLGDVGGLSIDSEGTVLDSG